MKTYTIACTFSSDAEEGSLVVIDFLKKVKQDEIGGPFTLLDATNGQVILTDITLGPKVQLHE